MFYMSYLSIEGLPQRDQTRFTYPRGGLGPRAVRPWLYRSVTLEFGSTKTFGTARLIKSLLHSADPRSTYRNYVQFLEITMRRLAQVIKIGTVFNLTCGRLSSGWSQCYLT